MCVCVRARARAQTVMFLVSSRRAGSNDLFRHYTAHYLYNARTIYSQLLSRVNIHHEENVTGHLMG